MSKFGMTTAPDGRKGFPGVMQYRDKKTGELFPVPPMDGRPYFVVIHDKTAYDGLVTSGWVYGDEHRGPSKGITDARKAVA